MPDPKAPASKPVQVVPVGDDYAKLVDDGFRWRVAVDSLGGHRRGAIVGAIHLQPGAQIDRLVNLGYLVPLGDDEALAAIEAGISPAPQPYPTVTNTPPKPMISSPAFEGEAKSDVPKVEAGFNQPPKGK